MNAAGGPWSLTAQWIFPVDGPPLERGVVTVDGDRVVAVEARGRPSVGLDLGDAAVLPGLVNAHTHLDLSGMRGLATPTPHFTDWLRQVIAHRRGRTPEQIQADIRAGLAESLRFGTTLLGDISGDGGSWDALTHAPLRAVVFLELLGLPEERARAALLLATKWRAAHQETSGCRPGFSPHAPYSFRSQFLFLAFNATLAIHLAETAAELELLESHRGPFVPFLADLGVWDPSGLPWGPAHIIELTRGAKNVLYVHANYLSPDSAIPSHGTIVYCPRTHAAFGHPPHPFREFLARGVRVAVGTDSLASNPDLDVLAEIRFLRGWYPDVSGATLLRMATLSGAEALGWADETGSLAPGKSADVVVVPIRGDAADPHDLLLDSDAPVSRVLFRGRWVV